MSPRLSPQLARSGTRLGMGAPFVIVISVLVILSLYAMSMSIRSQGASLQVRKAQSLETCESLARLVLEEAVYRMRSHASDAGSEISALIQSQEVGKQLHLGPAVLPRSLEELSRLGEYTFDGVDVEIVRWSPVAKSASEATGYEAVGMFRVSTRVRGPKSTTSYQEAEYGYRTALTSVPRPFDTFTFYLQDCQRLLEEGAFRDDPNETIRWASTMLLRGKVGLEESLKHIQEALSDAQSKQGSAVGADQDKLNMVIAALTALEADIRNTLSPARWRATPDWKVLGPGDESNGEINTLHLFAKPLLLYSLEEEVDLDDLNLPNKVGERVREVLDRQPLMQAAAAALDSAQGSAQSDPFSFVAAQKAVLELIEKDVATYHAILLAYKDFQDILVEVGGSSRQEILDRAQRLSPEEASRRASFRFEGEGQAEEAEKFLGVSPAPSGVVYVADPKKVLKLRVEKLQGRLVVYSKGPVDIERATVVNPDQDLLVCISPARMRLLQDGGQVAMVSLGKEFLGSGTSFQGSLILRDLPDRGAIDRTLKGTLKRQKSIQTAANITPRPDPDLTTVHVAIGPAPLYRRSSR